MATAASNPFAYTATGTLGDKRDTMLENQLLLRCEVGKPMKRGYTEYPGMSYRYGKPMAIKEGGAAEALSDYPGQYFHKCNPNHGNDGQADRDFMALNKSAVLAGLTSAPQHYQFRASHDIRRRMQTEGDKKKASRRILPHMVYGISTRPSTPIHDLLEHKYQDRWLQERSSAEQSRREKDEYKRLTPGKVYETRASKLRAHQIPVDSAPLWQLPKFGRKATPHLETFRTKNARAAAFSHHSSDQTARQGIYGQGCYEPAKY